MIKYDRRPAAARRNRRELRVDERRGKADCQHGGNREAGGKASASARPAAANRIGAASKRRDRERHAADKG